MKIRRINKFTDTVWYQTTNSEMRYAFLKNKVDKKVGEERCVSFHISFYST